MKADKTGSTPILKLVARNFQFHHLGRFNETGTTYLYPGESGFPGNGGNGGIYLTDLTNNTSRCLLAPNGGKQYALPQFYGDEIIYFLNRAIWRLAPGETNGTRLLP